MTDHQETDKHGNFLFNFECKATKRNVMAMFGTSAFPPMYHYLLGGVTPQPMRRPDMTGSIFDPEVQRRLSNLYG